MKGYLLDTNFLIHLSKSENDEYKKQVLTEFKQILEDDNSRLMITPLISYEVLRGIEWENDSQFQHIQGILEQFEMLNIDTNISDLATNLYRFDYAESQKNKVQKNFEKRKFDIFHFATAKVNNLEMLSKDSDMNSIETLYQKMQKSNTSGEIH